MDSLRATLPKHKLLSHSFCKQQMNRTTGEATAVKKMANAPIQKNLSDQLSEGGEEYF